MRMSGSVSPARSMARVITRAADGAGDGLSVSLKVNIIRPLNDHAGKSNRTLAMTNEKNLVTDHMVD
jgi:hypothetical protein